MPKVGTYVRRIAIVGSEAAKFTANGERRAKLLLMELIQNCIVVSGRCHLGGIDVWAEELADIKNLDKLIFPPAVLNWHNGYKPRNLKIAENCDEIHVVSVDELPEEFAGMKFDECYHCRGYIRPPHVKSGACWTANRAIEMGKPATWHVIEN